MLYPWDIARFRSSIDGLPERGVFDRHPFRRAVVSLAATGIRPEVLEPSADVGVKPPEKLFGLPEVQSPLLPAQGPIIAPPVVAYRVANATICGIAAVLDESGTLYNPHPIDASSVSAALQKNQQNSEGFVLRHPEGSLEALYFCAREPRRIESRALFFTNREIGNYGSFLLRVLPQLLAARRLSRDFDCYIVSDRSPWLREAIELLHLPNLPILEAREVGGETFDEITLIAMQDSEGLIAPWLRRELVQLSHYALKDVRAIGVTRKLYVSRLLSRVSNPQYRPLVNEIQVQSIFESAGFVTCYPETLPFAQQVRLFASADTVVGPSGSGMLNCLFSLAPRRALDLESFTVTIRQHAKLYASSGFAYAFCFGRFVESDQPEPSLRAWRLDTGHIEEARGWVLA